MQAARTAVSKIAFLFPGQGAQVVGMGQGLADSLPAAADLYRRAGAVLGFDLAEVCFGGPQERLNATDISQPALYVTGLAALEKLKAHEPQAVAECCAAAGLSLGEYTALAFAGVFEFEVGLRLVRVRGQAMQAASEAQPSGMISVLGLEIPQIEDICAQARRSDVLEIANLLCPLNTVLSGSQAACARAAELATAAGAMKVIPLAVAGAFHTSLMAPALERLAAALAEAPVARPRIPVVFNVDAQTHDDPGEIRELLVQQVVSPVRWEDSLRRLLALDCRSFYEVGPGSVLRGLLRRIDKTAERRGAMD